MLVNIDIQVEEARQRGRLRTPGKRLWIRIWLTGS